MAITTHPGFPESVVLNVYLMIVRRNFYKRRVLQKRFDEYTQLGIASLGKL